MKFKVGDTVVVRGNRGNIHHYFPAGCTGTIIECRTKDYIRYKVEALTKSSYVTTQVVDEIDLELLFTTPTTNQSALVFLKK